MAGSDRESSLGRAANLPCTAIDCMSGGVHKSGSGSALKQAEQASRAAKGAAVAQQRVQARP